MKKSAALIFVLFLCSCSGQQCKDSFFAMDTYMEITLNGNREKCDEIKELVYDKDNKFKKDGIDYADNEIIKLCEFSKSVSEFTGGYFDITVSPLCDLWGFWNNQFRVPDEDEISKALLCTGYDNISVTDKSVIMPEGFSVDFGGIAKGYTGDCITELLKKDNISGVISLGGNIVSVGKNSDGNPWRIGITDPFKKKDYIGYVLAEDCSVVTSGGYERYFEESGKKYVHIINPKTGRPAESDIASVTVVSSSGSLADALSTAFYCMGYKKTAELCESSGCKFENIDFSVIVILNDSATKTFGNVEFKPNAA